MILIIIAWLYYFLIFLSVGAGALKLFGNFIGRETPFFSAHFYKFWFGFILVIVLIQLLSLFLPLAPYGFILISLLGVVALVLNYRSVLITARSFFNWMITFRGFLSMCVIFLLLIMVAYSANKEIEHSDTFIYHFNAVKWAKDYSVVPGLANLHGRLGFNSSFFLFAAMADIGLYSDESAHIALSFLLVICAIHWFVIISSHKSLLRTKIFCLLTFPFLIEHMVWKMDITSLSTDYPTAVLMLLFCLLLLDNLKHKVLLMFPLSAVIMAFKLSGIVVVGIGGLVVAGHFIGYYYQSGEKKVNGRVLVASLALFILAIGGFFVRNAFVSGWLIYPFPIGNLHLPWSVPDAYVQDMMAWIKSYPKIPGGASPTTIEENGFVYWFTQWYLRFRTLREFVFFSTGLFLILYALFQLREAKRFFLARLELIGLLLFAVLGITFWFISAPEIRFGSVYFYVFFAASAILAYECSQFKRIFIPLVYTAFAYQAAILLPGFVIDRNPQLFTFPYTKPRTLVRTVASPPEEKPPLYIYMPAEGDACGNSPLPCTPYAGGFLHNHRGVRQRVPGDFSKGFLPLDKQLE